MERRRVWMGIIWTGGDGKRRRRLLGTEDDEWNGGVPSLLSRRKSRERRKNKSPHLERNKFLIKTTI